MDIDLFTRLLDTYGSDFRRWPEDHRAEAANAVETQDAARRLWQEASRLDALLRHDRALPDDTARMARITYGALRQIRASREAAPGWRWILSFRFGAAMASVLLAGWIAGAVAGPGLLASQPVGIPAVTLLLGYGAQPAGVPF